MTDACWFQLTALPKEIAHQWLTSNASIWHLYHGKKSQRQCSGTFPDEQYRFDVQTGRHEYGVVMLPAKTQVFIEFIRGKLMVGG